jgi:phage/plasmid-associated DNA primase
MSKKAKQLIAKLVEGPTNPMSNDHEAMKLRIKSMMSYEGYLEYYEAYSKWQKSQGQTAEKPMSRSFFDSRLASMPKSYRKAIVHQAGEWGVEIPRGFFT